jgi:hypothetical protein
MALASYLIAFKFLAGYPLVAMVTSLTGGTVLFFLVAFALRMEEGRPLLSILRRSKPTLDE